MSKTAHTAGKPAWQTSIQEAYSSFLTGKNLKARRGQTLMIADIAKNFAAIPVNEDQERASKGHKHLAVIEAGTGTGKTLAYLVACLPLAAERKKKLVLATATLALQEQLLLRDLPDLAKHTNLKFSYALAKGRSHYLCTKELVKALNEQPNSTKNASSNSALDLFQAELLAGQQEQNTSLLENLATNLADGSWDGDRHTLSQELSDQLNSETWAGLTSNHQSCTNRRCPHFTGACPFFNARRAMEEADLIVANHDLVLADLNLGGGVILPAPEETFYVFDEAHHLPNKALNHFAANFRFNATLSWLRLLKKSQPDLLASFGAGGGGLVNLLQQLLAPLDALEKDLGSLYGQLYDLLDLQQKPPAYRWPHGKLPANLQDFAQQLVVHFASLSRTLEALVNLLKDAQDPDKTSYLDADLAAEWQPLLAVLHSRALDAHHLWSLCAQTDAADQAPLARWLSLLGQYSNNEEDLELSASPVSAAGDLAFKLWSRCFGACLTSATLSALGKFVRFQERAGLGKDTKCASYPSPFNYPELGVLEIPPQACDPVHKEQHSAAILDYLEEHLITDKTSALVLFSSRQQMQEIYDDLPRKLAKITLTQDRMSKNFLLETHCQRIDKNLPSIIFGLASLAEGVDLPGKYLTHLVIVRLPFTTPDDPVEATLAEWIEAQGGNPFMQISVPDASIRLVQACGRLIRTETDSGRITLLDRRLLSKRYGSQLLNSLPPFKREFS